MPKFTRDLNASKVRVSLEDRTYRAQTELLFDTQDFPREGKDLNLRVELTPDTNASDADLCDFVGKLRLYNGNAVWAEQDVVITTIYTTLKMTETPWVLDQGATLSLVGLYNEDTRTYTQPCKCPTALTYLAPPTRKSSADPEEQKETAYRTDCYFDGVGNPPVRTNTIKFSDLVNGQAGANEVAIPLVIEIQQVKSSDKPEGQENVELERVSRLLAACEIPPDGQADEESDRALFNDLKRRLHTDGGPPILPGMTWAQIDSVYIAKLLIRASDNHGHTFPRRVIATVPATWGGERREKYRTTVSNAIEIVKQLGGVETENITIHLQDEASAAGVGSLSKHLKTVSGNRASFANLVLLPSLREPMYVLSVDIGASTTDIAMVSVQANTEGTESLDVRLHGICGFPSGGDAYSRLIAIMLVCRLAKATDALSNQSKEIQDLCDQLSDGSMPSDSFDPFLTGYSDDFQENDQSGTLLEALSSCLPLIEVRRSINRLAELIKLTLNERQEPSKEYLESIDLNESPFVELWEGIAKAADLDGMGNALDSTVTISQLNSLFSPATRLTLRYCDRLFSSSFKETELSGAYATAISLAGRGSLLRQFQDSLDQYLSKRETFWSMGNRVYNVEDPKSAVCEGGATIFSTSRARNRWYWDCQEFQQSLPFRLVKDQYGREVLADRGVAFTENGQIETGTIDAETVKIRRLAFDDDYPVFIGTFSEFPTGGRLVIHNTGNIEIKDDPTRSMKFDEESKHPLTAGLCPEPEGTQRGDLTW